MNKSTLNATFSLLVIIIITFVFPKTGLSQTPKQLPITVKTGSFEYRSMTQDPVENLEAIGPAIPYIIKCKSTQRVLDVRRAAKVPETQIWQWDLNATIAQRFIFEKIDTDYFYIRPLVSGYYLTADITTHPSIIQRELFLPQQIFTSALRDIYGRKSRYDSLKYFQQWKIEKSGEPFCFIITNRALPNMALQPVNSSSGVEVNLNIKSGTDAQKWLLKYLPFEENPDAADANFALDTKCNLFVSFLGRGSTLELSKIFPEWRSVGETNVPNGISIPFKSNLRTLEGEVVVGTPEVSWGDLPISHFTHDFNFTIRPDPAFSYLIAKNADQTNIDVEWECGIAQGNDKEKNPAQSFNRKGDSYGFFTAGHQRRETIWNWPTNKDWVHVEGQWIWDRGHPPANTEIHPPQFIGIKRYLPVKYTDHLPSGTFVYATRCDIFANGDGDIMWNNKGHDNFAQKVKISNKSYTVVFTQDLPRPSLTASLRVGKIIQKGDSYTINPTILINQNGTADNPTPHIIFTLPYSNESDKAVFARSYFLYWDDIATHGVPSSYTIKKLRINIDSVVALTNMDGEGEPGEFRLFANIGSNWFFLNEFVHVDDILSHGLGEVSLPGGFINFPDLYIFPFSLDQEIYVPTGKEVRMSVSGWEADYIDNKYGNIVNPYLPCQTARNTLDNLFSAYQYDRGGGSDDPLGTAEKILKFSDNILPYYRVNSRGKIDDSDKDNGSGITNPNNSFKAVFKVIKL